MRILPNISPPPILNKCLIHTYLHELDSSKVWVTREEHACSLKRKPNQKVIGIHSKFPTLPKSTWLNQLKGYRYPFQVANPTQVNLTKPEIHTGREFTTWVRYVQFSYRSDSVHPSFKLILTSMHLPISAQPCINPTRPDPLPPLLCRRDKPFKNICSLFRSELCFMQSVKLSYFAVQIEKLCPVTLKLKWRWKYSSWEYVWQMTFQFFSSLQDSNCHILFEKSAAFPFLHALERVKKSAQGRPDLNP